LNICSPEDNETPEVAKTRYLAALKTRKPTCTAIIDSGNGIQALWKLAEPIQLEPPNIINDEPVFPAVVADVEGRVKALMEVMGSVAGTQNIDRILRLPGTTNLPNKKKIKHGRVPCPTALIQFNGATCAVDDFPPLIADAPKPKDKNTDKPENGRAALPPMLAALLRVQGSGDYPSRSELLFAFLNEALRKGIDDSVIIRACRNETYSGNGIFEHVKENGGEEYIKEQIEHALNETSRRKKRR
jgi:hypothetical protein